MISGEFAAELWVGPNGSWHFVSLPSGLSTRIRAADDPGRPGFGSVRVEARIGAATWRTSVFPDAARGAYVLPVKAAVRRAEGVAVGDEITVQVRVVDGPPG